MEHSYEEILIYFLNFILFKYLLASFSYCRLKEKCQDRQDKESFIQRTIKVSLELEMNLLLILP